MKEYKKYLGTRATGDTSMTDKQKMFDYLKHGFTEDYQPTTEEAHNG